MTDLKSLSPTKMTLPSMVLALSHETSQVASRDDVDAVLAVVRGAVEHSVFSPDRLGIDPVAHNLRTSLSLCRLISPDRDMVVAVMLRNLVQSGHLSLDQVKQRWGDDVAALLEGLKKVTQLYER